jgi:hypothetical protein
VFSKSYSFFHVMLSHVSYDRMTLRLILDSDRPMRSVSTFFPLSTATIESNGIDFCMSLVVCVSTLAASSKRASVCVCACACVI